MPTSLNVDPQSSLCHFMANVEDVRFPAEKVKLKRRVLEDASSHPEDHTKLRNKYHDQIISLLPQ